MDGEVIQFVEKNTVVSRGSVGLRTQCPGAMASVSALAEASGGISPSNLVTTDF